MENGQQATFSVSGWLPNGMKVYFQMPMGDGVSAFDQALMFTNGLLEKGFSQQEPGLGKGEHKELIGLVARREKTNKDKTVSTVLDLYAADPTFNFRYMGVYLDSPQDIADFETASGLKLDNVPLNLADSPPSKDNTRLVMAPKKPLTVVYTNNPDYDEHSEAKKPKRLFVRWDGVQATSTPENGINAANANVGSNSSTLGADWNPETVKQFVTSYQGKLDTDQLLGALQVSRFGEWTQGKAAAYVAADAALKIAQVDF